MTISIILGLIAVLLLCLGLFFRKQKGLMLLAGYNTMPKQERDSMDKKELSRIAGNLMFRLALEIAFLGIAIFFQLTWAMIALIAVVCIDPCMVAFRMSGKYAKGKISNGGKTVTVVILAIVFTAMSVMFYYGEKEPVVDIVGDTIQIKGMYGLDLKDTDIKAISLIDKCMNDIEPAKDRTNGYGGFGASLKGHFRSEKLGKFMLFVRSTSAPTLWVECNDREGIYISFTDAEKTKALYNELKAALPSK